MRLEVGDLVQYVQDTRRLAIVVMTHTTKTKAEVCEVVIVLDENYPSSVGEKRYTNQDYWRKVNYGLRPLDASIDGCEDEYEEVIDLHKTHGES